MYYCTMIIRRRNTFFPPLAWIIERRAKILKGRTPFLSSTPENMLPYTICILSCPGEKWWIVSIVVSTVWGVKISRKNHMTVFPLDRESCARWYLTRSIYRSAKVFTVLRRDRNIFRWSFETGQAHWISRLYIDPRYTAIRPNKSSVRVE